jgi:DNA-binding GntR family transcriptional regulator
MSSALSSPVRARSLVEVVAERLEAAILSGELVAGSRLSEQALAASLGVSRGPLREAIRRLEGRKLVERIPNIGVRVAELTIGDIAEVLTIREALEGLACALAAEAMSDSDIDELDALLRAHSMQQDVKSGTAYYQQPRDFDFHFRIVQASRNARLIEMLCTDLYDLLRVWRYRASMHGGRASKAFEEHRAIVAALRTRDPALAEAAMRSHIRNSRLHVVAKESDAQA